MCRALMISSKQLSEVACTCIGLTTPWLRVDSAHELCSSNMFKGFLYPNINPILSTAAQLWMYTYMYVYMYHTPKMNHHKSFNFRQFHPSIHPSSLPLPSLPPSLPLLTFTATMCRYHCRLHCRLWRRHGCSARSSRVKL